MRKIKKCNRGRYICPTCGVTESSPLQLGRHLRFIHGVVGQRTKQAAKNAEFAEAYGRAKVYKAAKLAKKSVPPPEALPVAAAAKPPVKTTEVFTPLADGESMLVDIVARFRFLCWVLDTTGMSRDLLLELCKRVNASALTLRSPES